MTEYIHHYKVGTFREAGLLARWDHTPTGAPIILLKDPDKPESKWFYCDRLMWKNMQTEGIKEGFESYTLLGDIFYI